MKRIPLVLAAMVFWFRFIRNRKLAGMIACLALFAGSPAVAVADPFTFINYSGDCANLLSATSQTASCTFLGGSSLTATADYGELLVSYISTGSGSPVNGVTEWQDEFVVSGGAGVGSLTVDWFFEGSVDASGTSPPFDTTADIRGLDGNLFTVLEQVRFPGGEVLSIKQTGELLVHFVYDETFLLRFALATNTNNNTLGDFLLTTTFSLNPGDTLTPTAGSYPIESSAVPEPTSLLLLGTGLLGLGRVVRRRKLGRTE